MSTKSDYTPDQWQLLLDVPPLVGTAVMVAGRSGLGSFKEAFAVANATLGVQDEFDTNELIQSLAHARLKEGDRSDVEKLSNPYRGKSPEELKQIVVDKCSACARLLDEKSDPREAEEFKQWAFSVGQQVAHAAKEGGFLGIGGQRVSDEEREVLATVSSALGLSASDIAT